MEAHRFLNSEVPAPEGPEFSALGSSGYVGLEVFPNPGVRVVFYKSDEVVSACPITGQPDYYQCTIELHQTEKLIESKSLKLWFTELHKMSMFGKETKFCEGLAAFIRDAIREAIGEVGMVRVVLVQKSRGGISIEAWADD